MVISSKAALLPLLDTCLQACNSADVAICAKTVREQLLNKKIKFPLLEFAATRLYTSIPDSQQIAFCNHIQDMHTEGGNVILGMMLQQRLHAHFQESLNQAAVYVSNADRWYVCDIIGERVFGFSLLQQPEKTIPEIEKLVRHPSNWVVRALGAGMHYAIKKGLPKMHVQRCFQIMLSQANAKDTEVVQGIGWAAKTTAKFHPDIVAQFSAEIADRKMVANWFRKKVEIGLERHRHAQGN